MFDYEILINEIQTKPCLWNISDNDYHNKHLKSLAWNSIGKTILSDWPELSPIEKDEKKLTFGQRFLDKFPLFKARKPKVASCPAEKIDINVAPLERMTYSAGAYKFQGQFKQKLDHYDSTDVQYFQQRYFVYQSDDYAEGNPVFLLVGGIGELEPCDLEEGIWNHFAKESHALLIALEHRMYGKSYPVDKDFTTQNLVYLNTAQALADLAYFIDAVVRKEPKNILISRDAKWIAMGSSYGGTLATLLKAKFPHSIQAAATINAPLLPIVAYEEFYNAVEKQCILTGVDDTIREAYVELKKSFNSCDETDRECFEGQIEKYNETFNLCTDCRSTLYEVKYHKDLLYWLLTTTIGLALRFGNESKQTVKTEVIRILLDKQTIPIALNRLGEAVKLVLKRHTIKCLLVDYGHLIDEYKITSVGAEKNLNYIVYTGLGNRQTLYRHCSEWGHFDTAYKEEGIFAKLIPKEFFVNICMNVFGATFNAAHLDSVIKRTDMLYGGRGVIVNNVAFIIRDDDFWTQLGYIGRKPRNELTNEDSFTILLKPDENSETCTSEECMDDWTFTIQTLKNWSGAQMIEEYHNSMKFLNEIKTKSQMDNLYPWITNGVTFG